MFQLKTHHIKILGDTITPVSVYLKLRDRFPNSILLESSDYRANDNTFSYICSNPIAEIKVQNNTLHVAYPDGTTNTKTITSSVNIPQEITNFSKSFNSEDSGFDFPNNGLFGYMNYDAVTYYENIEISKKENNLEIPDIYYAVYQNVIAFDHFHNVVHIFSHNYQSQSNLEQLFN